MEMICKFFYLAVFMTVMCLALAEKSCVKHNVKFEYFRNCNGDAQNQFIQIKNLTFTLTEDCVFIPRGCFKTTKPLSSGKVDYQVSKPPFNKKGSEDICKQFQDADVKKTLADYKALPNKCPIQAGDYCISVGSSKVKNLSDKTLGMAIGTATGNFKVSSGNNKACVEFKVHVTKK